MEGPTPLSTQAMPVKAARDKDVPSTVEILSSMGSLGIGEELKDKILTSLSELENLQQEAPCVSECGKEGKQGRRARNRVQAWHSYREAALHKKIEALQGRLDTSRNMLQKLYRKHVHLEKEMQLQKMRKSSDTLPIGGKEEGGPFTPQSIESNEKKGGSGGGKVHSQDPKSGSDDTVARLHVALDASRRRGALLEANILQFTQGDNSKKLDMQLSEANAQAQLYKQLYERAGNEARKSLRRRAVAMKSSKTTSQESRRLIHDLQTRLQQEEDEREAEAAVYSSKLYELEKERMDWYVEKRLLEQKVCALEDEIRQRDMSDVEIETCIIALLDRLRVLESGKGLPSHAHTDDTDVSREFDELCGSMDGGEGDDHTDEFDILVG